MTDAVSNQGVFPTQELAEQGAMERLVTRYDYKELQGTPKAMRFNTDKLGFSMIPFEARIELARVYSMGKIKYERDNWRKGMDWSACGDSLDRHYTLFLAGENIDPETGCHHLAQVAWNALTLMIYSMHSSGTNNLTNTTSLKCDSAFNWLSGLQIGLTKEQLTEFKDKYGKK